jgi:putative sigma-54 modulation protein
MRLELRGHNADVTPGLRRFVEEKLAKLERLLNDRAVSAHAILSVEKHRHIADITLHARGERFLHGVGESTNWETSLTQAIAKISHQAQKLKTKQKEKRHRLKAPALEALEPIAKSGKRKPAATAVSAAPAERRSRARMLRTIRTSREAVKPMSVEDAAKEVEAGGDGVVVFRNPESQAISVLYRRRNGELTLVETEA